MDTIITTILAVGIVIMSWSLAYRAGQENILERVSNALIVNPNFCEEVKK